MQVTKEIRDRVNAKLVESIATIKRHYGVDVKMPVVHYKKGGSTAGVADYSKWIVDFNPVLLMENVDDFIDRTVPHELAHLANHIIYPESHARDLVWTGRGYKRTKRDVHGDNWQEIMRVLGGPTTRCHQYDTTSVKREKPKYAYMCSCCKERLDVGPKVNANIQRGKTYHHNGCRNSKLVPFVSVQQPAPTNVAPAAKPVQRVPAPIMTPGSSKIARCQQIYNQYKNTYTRAQIIALFVQNVNCTPAGASTYYATCKKAG